MAQPTHPFIEFRFEVTTAAGRRYDSGVLRTPYTRDLTPEKVHDQVVERFIEEWEDRGMFAMAGIHDEPMFLNIAHIEAIAIRWLEPETETPPAEEQAGGGVPAGYADSAE